MDKTKKIEKKDGFMLGVLSLMLSQVLIKLLGLVSKIFLTNKKGFGDIGNGIYGSGYQIYAMLLTISSIGVPNAIAKLISEKCKVVLEDKIFQERIAPIKTALENNEITNEKFQEIFVELFKERTKEIFNNGNHTDVND